MPAELLYPRDHKHAHDVLIIVLDINNDDILLTFSQCTLLTERYYVMFG